MNPNFSFRLIILLLLSCGIETKDKTAKAGTYDSNLEEVKFPQVNDDFDGFLRNFDQTQLSLEIKGCYLSNTEVKEFKLDHFIKFVDEYHYGYKRIPANGNFIATITLGAADCFLPVLTTFKLTGEKIDSKSQQKVFLLKIKLLAL